MTASACQKCVDDVCLSKTARNKFIQSQLQGWLDRAIPAAGAFLEYISRPWHVPPQRLQVVFSFSFIQTCERKSKAKTWRRHKADLVIVFRVSRRIFGQRRPILCNSARALIIDKAPRSRTLCNIDAGRVRFGTIFNWIFCANDWFPNEHHFKDIEYFRRAIHLWVDEAKSQISAMLTFQHLEEESFFLRFREWVRKFNYRT